MANLRSLIVEIHRRSLWQVLMIYLGASWAVMEVTDQVIDRFLLPEWVYAVAFLLLAIGFPIVMATAFVREERREAEPVAEFRDPTLLGDVSQEAAAAVSGGASKPVVRLFTWPRAILGGVLAFTALATFSAVIVLRGTARVAEARGTAGDAFEERAWIVVADFEAPEDEAETALAAQTALTLDLQQSQYVNVRSRNQIAPVLARMGLPDTVRLDEQLALEVAEREGLAAVLTASISRLRNNYVLGARVIEPGELDELIAVRSVVGQDRLVEGVETLSRELRSRLGEERKLIRQSKPLPEVTTSSLEALKKFARARAANEVFSDYDQAVDLADEAIRADSNFATAYGMAAVAHNNAGRFAEGRIYSIRAYELRDRLPDRERLYLEAWYNWAVLIEPRRVVDAYELILSQHPDEGRALNNLGVASGVYLGDHERTYRSYRRALEISPSPLQLGNAITSAVFVGRTEAADSLIRRAEEEGYRHVYLEGQIDRSFVQEKWTVVDAFCDSLLAESVSNGVRANNQLYCGSIDAARGRLRRGLGRLEEAGRHFAETAQYTNLSVTMTGIVLGEESRRREAASRARLEAMLDRLPADSIGEPDRFLIRTELLVLAGLLESSELLDRVRSAYPPYPDSTHWLATYGDGLAGAAEALANGDPTSAIERLRVGTASGYKPFYWVPLTELLFGLAFDDMGQVDSAVVHLEAAANLRNNFVSTFPLGRFHLPAALRRLAELEESRGNREAAIDHYRRFSELWSDADPELRDQLTSAQRALARLTGTESS